LFTATVAVAIGIRALGNRCRADDVVIGTASPGSSAWACSSWPCSPPPASARPSTLRHWI